MKITEKEFEAIESALCVAINEGPDHPLSSDAFDKMREVYKRYRWFIDSLEGFDPSELTREYQEEFGEDYKQRPGVLSWREKQANEIKELKRQVEELKKENTELERELSVHNFLDTGVPQERLDYQRELKKEIIRLKSLNRRAADEIRDLDNIIIDFVEGNAFPHKNEDDLWAGEASINLLNRLDGRTKGGYVENYDDLHLEMKTLDGYAQIEHPDFYQKQEHSPECKWHKDWHACDCGAFDDEEALPNSGVFPETGNTNYSHNRLSCVAYQEGGIGCSDCFDFICDICGRKTNEYKTIATKQLSGVVMCDKCSGGNTTERVEEQAARLEKISKQKEINKMVDQVESAAVKAAHKVMEQHSEAFEKLAENKE